MVAAETRARLRMHPGAPVDLRSGAKLDALQIKAHEGVCPFIRNWPEAEGLLSGRPLRRISRCCADRSGPQREFPARNVWAGIVRAKCIA